MREITVKTTNAKQIIDITERLEESVRENGWRTGLLHAFVKHTTCALTTADLDPGTDQDMLDAFEAMLPKLTYRHPHDPSHVGDHIMSSLIGPQVVIPIKEGALELGTWQRVVLVELNGPRDRTIAVSLIGERHG